MSTTSRGRRLGERCRRAFAFACLVALVGACVAVDRVGAQGTSTTAGVDCLSGDPTNTWQCWKYRSKPELEALLGVRPGSPFQPPDICGVNVDSYKKARDILSSGWTPCKEFRRELLTATLNIRRSVLFGDGLMALDTPECFGVDPFRIVLRCGEIFVPDETTSDPDDAVAIDETTPLGEIISFANELCALADCPGSKSAPCGKTLESIADVLNEISRSKFNDGDCALCKGDKTKPVITCPTETVLIECQGPDGGVLDYTVTATDNCDPIPKIVCFPPPGTTAPVNHTISVVCSAEDLRGNRSKCSFNVRVVDTTPPELNCPDRIVVNCADDTGSAVVEYPTPTANDLCDGAVEVECDPPSGSVFPEGVTTVTCATTDSNGNVSTCSFEVEVVRDPGVELICASDIEVECTGPDGTVVEYPAPIVSSTCVTPPDPVCVPPSGSVFPIGSTVVTCSTTDGDGNPVSCEFTVTVKDTQPPVITCPSDLLVECAGPVTTVNFTVEAVDRCDDEVLVMCDPPSGSSFPPGTTTVICTAIDASGNESGCEFDIIVRDTTPPVLSCPAGPIRADCDVVDPFPGAVVNYTMPMAEDGCDGPLAITCDPPSGTLFPLGTTTVTCVAVDASGNEARCEFDVEVVDDAPPMLVCLDDLVVECESLDGAVVNYTQPQVADDCDEFPDLVCVPPAGSLFSIGETTATCTATDDSGNSVECSFRVIVEDSTPPALACPADMILECTSPAGTEAVFSATATDTCDADPVVTCDPPSGSLFGFGPTTVTCTATDDFGNESRCEFTVSVVDTTPPEISCPDSTVAECLSPNGTAVTFMVTAADICDDDVEVVCTPASGSLFPVGTTRVTCTAMDDAGNTSQCEFDVTVVDTTPPSINCTQDAIVVECDGELEGVVQYPLPTVNDVCDPSPTLVCEPPSGSSLPVGTHTITCTATDAAGNESQCTFDIEVVDTAPPEMMCPSDLVRECAGPDGTVVTYELPSATDTCDPLPNLVCLPEPGSSFSLGTTEVMCTADDRFGNLMTCTFTIEVVDTTPPAIQCPGNVSEACTTGAGAPVSFDVTATDICDPTPIVSCDPPSGSIFPIGETLVTCIATDRSGNVSTCEFTVVVRDDVPPGIPCPDDFELECAESGVVVADFPLPEVTDNCDDAPSVVCDPPPGTELGLGAHLIVCTATDATGNESRCEFTVTVIDSVAPELICPPDMMVECETPEGAVVNYDLPVANDACDGQPPVDCSPPPGSLFPLGSTEVTCTATDRSGNEIQCSFVVTVVDTTPPELICSAEVVADCSSPDGARVEFEPGVSDLCDPTPSLVCDPPSGSQFPLGQTTVTCTSTDAAGNESQCSFTVTVVDRTGPDLIGPGGGGGGGGAGDVDCPPDMEIECTTNGQPPHKPPGWPPGSNPEPNECTAIVEYPLPEAIDGCQDGNVQVVCTPPSGSKLMMGTHEITCRAVDAAGNETTCTFTVNVVLGLSAFVRGDANADGSCDIGDAIWLINHLFLGNPAPACLDAGDCNDDGTIDLGDALWDLNFIFMGGEPPPEPYLPLCGLDPTDDDALDCERFLPCE